LSSTLAISIVTMTCVSGSAIAMLSASDKASRSARAVSARPQSLRRDDSDFVVFRFAEPEDAEGFCRSLCW
jgi:hypothetical protein